MEGFTDVVDGDAEALRAIAVDADDELGFVETQIHIDERERGIGARGVQEARDGFLQFGKRGGLDDELHGQARAAVADGGLLVDGNAGVGKGGEGAAEGGGDLLLGALALS